MEAMPFRGIEHLMIRHMCNRRLHVSAETEFEIDSVKFIYVYDLNNF